MLPDLPYASGAGSLLEWKLESKRHSERTKAATRIITAINVDHSSLEEIENPKPWLKTCYQVIYVCCDLTG
jgi:hypothetical protein